MDNTLSYAPLMLVALLIVIVIFRMNARADAKRHQSIVHTSVPDVVGPVGERVVVSVGPECRSLPVPHDTISMTHSSTETVLHECGHHGPTSYDIDAYGTIYSGIDNHRWCPDCLVFMFREKAIRCARCGHVICPGDAVVLYEDAASLEYKPMATKANDSFVGCVRWDCCPSGAFFAGYWTDNGFRSTFLTTGGFTHPDMPEKTV